MASDAHLGAGSLSSSNSSLGSWFDDEAAVHLFLLFGLELSQGAAAQLPILAGLLSKAVDRAGCSRGGPSEHLQACRQQGEIRLVESSCNTVGGASLDRACTWLFAETRLQAVRTKGAESTTDQQSAHLSPNEYGHTGSLRVPCKYWYPESIE